MSKKIEVYWGGGSETILYSAGRQKFFSYERDREFLHKLYGGKNFYISGSGLTGKGFLEPSDGGNDLVRFGWYRTDAYGELEARVVGFGVRGEAAYLRPSIFGYVPIASHAGIQEGFPVVLTDGQTVAFLPWWKVGEALRTWDKVIAEAKPKNFSVSMIFDDGDGNFRYEGQTGVEWALYNPEHMGGVDALRFVDLRAYRKELYARNPEPPMTCKLLGLLPVVDWKGQPCWAHLYKAGGVYDTVLDVMPQMIDGEVGFDGWVSDSNGVLWRRRGVTIQAFAEMFWETFANSHPTLDYPDHPVWIDFEEDCSVMEWYSMGKAERLQRLETGIVSKAQSMLAQYQQQVAWERQQIGTKETLIATLREHSDLMVSFGDSLAVGNCEPGTRRFCEHFGLDPERPLTIGQILGLKSFERMIVSPEFERVLWHVINKSGVVATPGYVDDDEDLLGSSRIGRRESPSDLGDE